jgi:hypothetical protein
VPGVGADDKGRHEFLIVTHSQDFLLADTCGSRHRREGLCASTLKETPTDRGTWADQCRGGISRVSLDHRSHFRHGPPGQIEIGVIGASSLPFQVCRSNRAPRLIHLLIDCLLHSWSPETDYTASSLDLPRHHRLHRIHVTVLLEFL